VVARAIHEGWWSVLADGLDWEARIRDAVEDIEGLKTLLKKTERLLPQAPSVEGRVRFLSILALACFFGDPDRGADAARKAVSLAKEGPCSDAVRLNAMNRLLVCLVAQGLLNTDEGQFVLRSARELAERRTDAVLSSSIMINEAVWRAYTGDPAGALSVHSRHLRSFEGESERIGPPRVRGNRALALIQLHRYHDALTEFEAAERLATPLTPRYHRRMTQAGMGICHLRLGRMAEAKKQEELVLPLPQTWTADPTWVVRFVSELNRIRGRSTMALEIVQRAASDVKKRFPVHWIDLVIIESELRRKVGLRPELARISEALKMAKGRQLRVKELQLAALHRRQR
jgi:hypothetical protein